MRSRWKATRLRLKLAQRAAKSAARSLLARLNRARKWLDRLDIPLSQLQWILLLYAIFGLLYTFSTPAFEAHEEIWHFGYVQHLRATGDLPRQVFDGSDTIYAQHGSQPPLYYALMALLTSPFDISQADVMAQLNPYVARSQPDSWGNKNLIVPAESPSAWQDARGTIVLIRLAGLAFGAMTVALAHRIGRIVSPQRHVVAFAAAAVTAFNPMFIFVCASVSNDSLAMLLNAGLILGLLTCVKSGFSATRSLIIGLLFAASCLTKLTALAMLPALLFVAALLWWRRRDRAGAALYIASLLLCWLLIAGWWHWRNLQLYGEPTGMLMMANIAGPRGPTFGIGELLADFQHFRMSYWGLFGALNIQLSSLFYLLLDLVSLLSLFGCAFLLLQLLAISDFAYARYELAYLATLACIVAPLLIGVLYWNTLTRAADGRILFPFIAAISPLVALGFVEMVWWTVFSLRPPNLEFVRAGDAVPRELLHGAMLWQLRFFAIVALLAPITVIAGQYAAPQTIARTPDNASPVYAAFDEVALLAYERVDRRYSPGDKIRVKLYWQPLSQSASDKSLVLTLVDDYNQTIGRYESYPGAGKLRTSTWQPNAIYPDEYVIPLHAAATGRYPFGLRVEWRDQSSEHDIMATDADGMTIAPVRLNMGAVVSARVGDAGLGFLEIPADQQPAFDDSIRLERYFVDQELNELMLGWKTETAPDENYTVFAHLLAESGELLAQADAPPRLPTKYWRWGETFTTHHTLPADLPLLEHTLSVGWYLNDGDSLPRLEYFVEATEDETEALESEYRDAYIIPWDIMLESIQLTQEAADATATASASDETDISDEPTQ